MAHLHRIRNPFFPQFIVRQLQELSLRTLGGNLAVGLKGLCSLDSPRDNT